MDKKINAKKYIKELVQRFDENISQYKRPDYDEANTRADFIDPFFENLGWDVANKQGYAEQYREVVREAKVTIAGKQKAPDYSFRIGGIRKFFVEAKKPSVDLKHEISPAYQLKRYAYTAKLPLSILTDFEEFSVYDTRIKPTPVDSASCARIFYCRYKDYLKNLDFIYDTFSKDGLLKGSFDRYVESSRGKKGTSEVDKEFLKLIDKWREKLAKNVALRNKSLSLYELNFAVQKIIDRIIFLRIAEDRQIEDYGKLQNLLNGTNTYRRLMEIFLHSDKKYNSGLFDFKKDEITHSLSVDDKIIKEILKSVYYPESPYEFSVLDVEILGNIYEQFLGKTIRLTPAHQVKVEEKPEVKKAGGVYYTPKYIVDYIVKNTVGEIIKSKTPKQIDKLKLLDPACGSGSFLLGAYQCLLNYHLDWYSKDKNCKKALKKGQIVQIGKDSFQLTIAEKQRILLNNIFGVDIDTQAVEVSKLSLLLKLLEGETEESTGRLFKYTQMGLLPDLSNNIKCGNSLISPDFYKQMSLLNDDEARRINAFDWESAFPDIFENGGFDVVIGNPPYVTAELEDYEREYYKKNYPESTVGKLNTYRLFTHKGWILLRDNGLLGFIIPNTYLTNRDSQKIRELLLNDSKLKEILFFPEKLGIFKGVTQATTILIFEKTQEKLNKNIIKVIDPVKDTVSLESNLQRRYAQHLFLAMPEHMIVTRRTVEQLVVIKKVLNVGRLLDSFADVYQGEVNVSTNKDSIEIIRKSMNYMPLLRGNNIGRYYLNLSFSDKKGSWVDSNKPFRKHQNGSRIVTQEVSNMQKKRRLNGMLIHGGVYVGHTANYLLLKDGEHNPHFFLALLNSYLLDFIFQSFNNTNHIPARELKRLPIRTIDFSNPSEKAMHDKLVTMVERMLELQKKFHSARLESDKKMYKTQIDVLDNQIDSLVYGIYGLTEEEIKIIKKL